MKVVNPTQNDISVQIEGTRYDVEANGSINGVSDSHAKHWKENIHQFIELVSETPESIKEEVEKIINEVADIAEEPAKPKASKAKNK